MKIKYSKKINYWLYIKIIFFIVIFDFFSKKWIINNVKIYEIKHILSVLNISHVHNYGAAFSILSDKEEWKRWFLSIISIGTILVILGIIIKSKRKEKNKNVAYSLIVAGAIGNLIDRLFYGFVIDFIDIHINNWHFATFNIADCSIFIGILILTQINY